MPGSENRQRAKRVTLRFSEAEYDKLCAKADKAGLSLSAFLRHAALGSAGPRAKRKPPIDRELFARALAQLGKLGSNVNQLAKYGNQGRLVSNKHLKEAAEQIAILRAVFFIAIGRDPGELPPTVRDIIEDDN